jgi:hypothetical protein
VGIRDDRFARDNFEIRPAGKETPEEVTLSPPPARIFEGLVLYADTRQPAPKARLEIGASDDWLNGPISNMFGQTDAAGHFRLNPHSGKFFHLTVYPPQGEPYLIFQKEIRLAAIAPPPKIEIALPRGVVVRGKIVETSSGKPVAGASILYDEHSSNTYARDRIMPDYEPPPGQAVSGADGTFRIAVTPGRGTLFIQGPGNDYVYRMIAHPEFAEGSARGVRYYVNAFVPLDLSLESEPPELNVAIRRGVTVRGRIVGPDDRPVEDTLITSRLFISADETWCRCSIVTARGGVFELRGLDPENAVPVYFLDPKNELGATVPISGKSAADQPLLVRLSPCGKALARFVDPAGKPRVKYEPNLQIVVTPGPFRGDLRRARKELNSDQGFVANFDRQHYWHGLVTDEDGRCTFPALIPGATYRILIFRTPGEWGEQDFTVKSGETLQLPDIVIPEAPKDN